MGCFNSCGHVVLSLTRNIYIYNLPVELIEIYVNWFKYLYLLHYYRRKIILKLIKISDY